MIKSQLEKQTGFQPNPMNMIEADPATTKKNKKTVPGSTSYLQAQSRHITDLEEELENEGGVKKLDLTKLNKDGEEEDDDEESGESSYYDTEEDEKDDIPAMPQKTDDTELYPSDSSFMKDMQLLKNLQALKNSIEPKMIV